jgi:asparagine synthase (glutamine-hydrolysing)
MIPGIRSRGPDGTGMLAEHGVGLLHTRLAIIDLITGDQPLWNETRTVACILNGEIYNYRELTKELRSRHSFATRSDTEVIVHLYEELGDDCLHELRGMYALAIWDAPRRRLLVARDRLGIKPLYTARLDSGFAFASSIESLLAGGASRDPDSAALTQFLQFQKVPEPRTAYREVATLPPAHYVSVDVGTGRVERRRFYRHVAPTSGDHREEAVCSARAAFERSVSTHLVADVEVAAFLSGGVDSSLVVAQAQRLSSRPLRTYCVSFRDAVGYDESDHAARVARAIGTCHETIDVSMAPADVMRTVLDAAQQPFAVASFVPLLLLCREAARHVKVVLTGDGGDEVDFGYPWYRWMVGASRLPGGVRRARSSPWIRRLEMGAASRELDRMRRVLKFIRGALSTGAASSDAWRYELTGPDALALLRPEHRPPALPPSPYEEAWDRSLGDVAAMRKADLDVLLRDEMLPKLDRSGMAFGLEGRVPLLDDDFVEAMLAVPVSAHLPDRKGKAVLRAWAREMVPGIDLDRPKHGFDVPVRAWLLDGLREDVRRLVLDDRQQRLTDPVVARGLWHQVERGGAGAAHAFFAVLMAETWFAERVLQH